MSEEKERPKLELIEKAEAEKPDPFDPKNLTIELDSTVAAKKVLLRVPCRKPGKSEFIRVRDTPGFTLTCHLVTLDREFFLVAPGCAGYVPQDHLLPFKLSLALTRGDVLFFWPIRQPGPDDKENGWWSSANEICELAKTRWVRVISNQASGMYEAAIAEVALKEPQWPENKSMGDLLKLAFGKNLIDSLDHPILQQLYGQV